MPNADLSRSESGVSGEKDTYGDMTQAKIKLKSALGLEWGEPEEPERAPRGAAVLEVGSGPARIAETTLELGGPGCKMMSLAPLTAT